MTRWRSDMDGGVRTHGRVGEGNENIDIKKADFAPPAHMWFDQNEVHQLLLTFIALK